MEALFSCESLSLLFFTFSIVISLGAGARTHRNTLKQKHLHLHTFKMVALDLDGTALNTNHTITQVTVDKLRALSDKGIQISIATGRSLGAVIDTLSTLKLGVEVPVVCLNGAMCIKVSKDAHSVVKVFDDCVAHSSAVKLLAFAASRGLVAQYYIESKVYAAPKTDEHRNLLGRYSTLTGKQQHLVPDYSSPLEMAPASKILLMTDDADELIAEASRMGFDEEFHLIKGSPYPFFVEFLAPGINKGSGLQKMCMTLQYDLADVVAFGDGENDKEFLQLAGLGVAMRNASDLAKDAADVVNPWTNDEDGVARYLDQMEKRKLL
jgi:Cof subfamily protein (haloacid dehalogenase superfamily)